MPKAESTVCYWNWIGYARNHSRNMHEKLVWLSHGTQRAGGVRVWARQSALWTGLDNQALVSEFKIPRFLRLFISFSSEIKGTHHFDFIHQSHVRVLFSKPPLYSDCTGYSTTRPLLSIKAMQDKLHYQKARTSSASNSIQFSSPSHIPISNGNSKSNDKLIVVTKQVFSR